MAGADRDDRPAILRAVGGQSSDPVAGPCRRPGQPSDATDFLPSVEAAAVPMDFWLLACNRNPLFTLAALTRATCETYWPWLR
jgi:hypothetical protein